MFKSLLSLVFSDLLFPLALIACAVGLYLLFPEHWQVLMLLAVVILVIVFSKISNKLDKSKK